MKKKLYCNNVNFSKSFLFFLQLFLITFSLSLSAQNNLRKKAVLNNQPKKVVLNSQSTKISSLNHTQQKRANRASPTLALSTLAAPTYSFKSSNLKGVSFTTNPTSLQFGPDSRLYVSEQKGLIRAYTIVRDSANHYSVTATETISIINQIPNHNDDGSLNTGLNTRQITGILVKGTAANPVIYVSSSDSRYGGPSGSVNIDTNSGIISTLTWDGTKWVKIDLVRGLPRSEENHATNGLQLDEKTNILYAAQGGNTNAGSPSHNFDYTGEYALSAAILSIDLNVINSMPVRGSGNTAYIYDLPTLDDPTRANNSNGTDVNDPFGGNNGLNQAKIVPGGPIQVYSPGYRNAYDIVITKARNLYTIDNGANQGWGGYPENEGTSNVTNNYLPGEPGSTGPTATQQQVNNLDNLHFIGNMDTYKPGSFYGGHPNPTRANPAGAGLYNKSATDSEWRYSTTGAFPLPKDWPPVPKANPIEGYFKMPGVADGALLTFQSSTDGIAEYTASNFNGALQGNLFACGYNAGKIFRIKLTSDGKGVTNSTGASTLNLDQPFAQNFGSDPLDITTEDDSSIFPGTMWVAVYGAKAITIFEPSDFSTCTGLYNSQDDDGDNYTNADEMDNGTDPCSALSVPPDWNHNFISDLNDPDDDSDGIPDSTDFYCRDANNGISTTIPVAYDLFNNDPGTGFFGQGFTGLMTNYHTDYLNLYDPSNLVAGGTAGVFTIKSVSAGDALGNLNNQESAFQFGVKASNSLPFTIVGALLGPFFNNQTPNGSESQGIYIGNGDQDNYLKITVNANGGAGGIQVAYENAGVPVISQFPLKRGSLSAASIDLYLFVDPVAGTVQPQYSVNKGQVINVGLPIQVSGALFTAIRNVYAVGVIATSRGGSPFTASWDFINVTNTPSANAGADATITLPANSITLNGSGTDADGTINAYSWSQVSGPNTATFSPNNTAQNPTIGGLVQGTYTFILNVTDDLNAVSKADTVIITVNHAPIANAGPDITITLPTNTTTLNGSGTSAYGSVSSYTWNQVNGPNMAAFSPNNTIQSPTINGLVQGIYTFTLNVSDSLGAVSKADSIIVTVNQATTANAGSDITVTLPSNSTNLSGSGTSSNTISSYNWSQVSGPNTAAFSPNNSAQNPTVSGLVQGIYVFSLNVTDNLGNVSNADSMTVTVNQAPTANAGRDTTIILPANSTVLNGSGSGAYGVISSYNWSQASGPNTATFSPGYTAQNPTVNGLVQGTYTFTLTVTDSLGAVSQADSVNITVTQPPPTANTGQNITITLPANSTALTGSGSSAYGSISSYNWSQVSGPNTAAFSPGNTTQNPTVGGLVQGNYVFALTVTDNLGSVSTASRVTVTVNQAPVANAGSDITITLPVNSTVLSGSGSGTSSISSYSWSQVSGPNTAAFSPGNTAQNPTVSGLVQGSYIFTLNVTDNNGSISKPDSVNVTVGISGIVTQTWQTLTPSSGAIIGREENGYVQAGNKFYLMGGRGIVAVQEYNPANKSWTNKSNPPIEMNHFQPVNLNGLIYATGSMNGLFPHEIPLSKVYVYNSASDKWFTGSTIPAARRRGAAGAVAYNNKIYVVGGITDGHWYGWVKWFDEYDPATNTWKTLPDAPRVRDHFQAVVINNKLYVAGGRRSFDSTGHLFDLTIPEVDVYDFAASAWSTLPVGSNLPIPRAGASNVVSGNQLIIIGGESGIQTAAHKETHALDVTTNTWRRLADLQTGRHGTGAVLSDNSIYIASGPSSRGGKPLLTSQEVYYTSAPASNNGNPIPQSQLTSASSVSFTGVAVNSSSNKTVTLTNAGSSQDILITSVSISGSSSFTYTTPYPLPFTVSAGQSVNISVTFKPVTAGTQTANLIVNHSGQNNSNTIALSGGQSGSSNIPPIANAGPDKAITVPANSVVLSGSGTDADGTVSSYMWKQVSGPNNTATFSPGTTAQSPNIGGLIQGAYTFTLTVTDNLGASSKPDSVVVTVNGANSGITFTLINAATNQAIQTLNEGNVLNLATLPSTKLNIQANTTPATVGSVVFNLSGAQTRKQIETIAPYALFGDVSGKYNAWTPALGYYTLKATPFSAGGGGGTAGTSLTLNFSVVNQTGFVTAKKMSGEASIKRNVQLEQLMLKSEANTLKAYPNPSDKGRFTVLLPAKTEGKVSFTLLSSTGNKLAGGMLYLNKSISTLSFDFSREMVAAGLYYLILESNEQETHVELIRSK